VAGDWLKWSKGFARKREVIACASKLKLPRRLIAGILMELFEWADDNTADGNVRSVTGSDIDAVVDCPGLAAALEEVGWLRVAERGITFVNFSKHNGQSAKARALTSERVKRARNAASVSEPLPEKRREEKSKKKDKTPLPPKGNSSSSTSTSPDPDPPEDLTEPMRDAWRRWCAHRRQIKHAVRPAQADALAGKFRELGEARVVAAVSHSILNGWQGLFEPKDNSNGRPTQGNSSGSPRGERQSALSAQTARAEERRASEGGRSVRLAPATVFDSRDPDSVPV